MQVKDVIEALMLCNPEAEVGTAHLGITGWIEGINEIKTGVCQRDGKTISVVVFDMDDRGSAVCLNDDETFEEDDEV